MGKGDKKTRRGKIIIGSFGVRRARKKKKGVVPPALPKEIKIKAKAVEEPVKAVAVEAVVEEKKAPKKAAVKKTAEKTEEAESKPKAPRAKKKAEPKEGIPGTEAPAEAPKE